MAKKGASNSGSEVARVRADEAARQERIRQGTSRISDIFGQFDDEFYEGRRDSFTNYATPQLQDQHQDAQKQLTFALDRRGALDSSSRASQEGDLEKRRGLLETEIKDKALDHANTARSNVEGARSGLIQTLNATGDTEGAVNSAQARATVLSQSPGYSPLVSLFSDFTAGLGQQAAAERAFSYGAGPKPTFSTGLFGTPRGAVENRG